MITDRTVETLREEIKKAERKIESFENIITGTTCKHVRENHKKKLDLELKCLAKLKDKLISLI